MALLSINMQESQLVLAKGNYRHIITLIRRIKNKLLPEIRMEIEEDYFFTSMTENKDGRRNGGRTMGTTTCTISTPKSPPPPSPTENNHQSMHPQVGRSRETGVEFLPVWCTNEGVSFVQRGSYLCRYTKVGCNDATSINAKSKTSSKLS